MGFLGHQIGGEAITKSRQSKECAENMSYHKKQVRSFVGLKGYNRDGNLAFNSDLSAAV